MKKLREILEVKRTIERAEKLLGYVQKRWHNNWGDTPVKKEYRLKDYENVTAADDKYDDSLSSAESGPIKKVKIKDLNVLQKTVRPSNVKTLLNRKNDPIRVVSLDNKLFIQDGHHRYFAAKLRGDAHIDAHVRKLNLTDKQKRRKRLYGSIDKIGN